MKRGGREHKAFADHQECGCEVYWNPSEKCKSGLGFRGVYEQQIQNVRSSNIL